MSWEDGHDGTRETCRCRNCTDWREGRAYILHKDGTQEWAPGKGPNATPVQTPEKEK